MNTTNTMNDVNIENIRERIFRYIEDNRTVVFPNQLAADSWAVLFAKEHEGRAVFADRIVSWDTFRNSLTVCPPDRMPASEVHRLFFTINFFRENKLPSLLPPVDPQCVPGLENELALMLPDLPKTLETGKGEGGVPDNLRKDIEVFLKHYNEYLKENGLYEKSFLKPDFGKAADRAADSSGKKPVLVFPSVISDGQVEKAMSAGLFDIVDFQPLSPESDVPEKPVVKVFDNIVHEIRSTVCEIRELLENGTGMDEIMITVCDASSIPWFVSEAGRRGIKINVIRGRKLSSYDCGKLFHAIKNVPDTQWSIDSVRDLLTDPVFPFRESRELSALVDKAVEIRVSFGVDSWKYKLKGTAGEQLLGRLIERISAFEKADSIDSLRQAVHGFEDAFFLPGFPDRTGVDVQSRSYARCLTELEKIGKLEKLEKLGKIEKSGKVSVFLPVKPFDFFIRTLDMITYTPVPDETGIPLYLYPSDAGVTKPYMFGLGFDDEAVRHSRNVPPFVQLEGKELGDRLIELYSLLKTRLSCAVETFSGHVSVPGGIVTQPVPSSSELFCHDSFYQEEQLWKTGDLSFAGSVCENLPSAVQLQKQWYEKASATTLVPGKLCYDGLSLPVKIRGRDISEFVKCPYRWYLSFVKGLSEKEYQPEMEDYMGVGNLMHTCLEVWLEKVKILENLSGAGSREELKKITDSELKKYCLKKNAPDKAKLAQLELTLADKLYSFAEKLEVPSKNCKEQTELIRGTEFSKKEKSFEIEKGSYSLNGVIDCILRSADGSLVLIDFKKSNVEKDSYQLEFYAKALLELNPDVVISEGAYYSVEQKKFIFAWTNTAELEKRLQKLDSFIDSMVECARNREAEPERSKQGCKRCKFRQICRQRYVVR